MAYGGAARYICGVKETVGHPITQLDAYWTALIGFYRARVEQVIARLKRHQWCQQVFRGSFSSLVQHHTVTSVFTALAIRREIESGHPLFEVIGPWPHQF